MTGFTAALWSGKVSEQERRLRRELGYPALTAIGFSNIVGSGWLFAAMYAAQAAGPAALLSWVGAGLLCALVALVMVELGATRPEGGGTVRWPLLASGRLVGTVIGWSALLSVGGTAAEISAILRYTAHYLPWLYHGRQLTVAGFGFAAAFSVLLTVLNWFGVAVFARLNSAITVLKIAIPLITCAALWVSGFHPGRLVDHGGFAPYGYAACLSALAGSGIVYSVNGFQAPLDFSGEARNPRRTVPIAVLSGIALALVMYLALQATFLFTVPDNLLGRGWRGVDFESPFGQLALILNLHWLAGVLYADAVLSPGGSAYVGVALNARHTYALAKNGLLPRALMRINPRQGIPQRALLLNLAVILVFLLPFGGWQDIVSVMGDLYLLSYAASAVAAAILTEGPSDRAVVPGLRWIAPVSFVVSSEFVYWSGWHDLRIALPLVLVGLLLSLGLTREASRRELRDHFLEGAWIVVYLLMLLLLSWLGSFDGNHMLAGPYDSVAVGVAALAIFICARTAGRATAAAAEPPNSRWSLATDGPTTNRS
ncbi:MAG: APC family permease [Mycobacteriaceae bacterium]|nr:APC family permease [Mycobacteriaceae bacterium]